MNVYKLEITRATQTQFSRTFKSSQQHGCKKQAKMEVKWSKECVDGIQIHFGLQLSAGKGQCTANWNQNRQLDIKTNFTRESDLGKAKTRGGGSTAPVKEKNKNCRRRLSFDDTDDEKDVSGIKRLKSTPKTNKVHYCFYFTLIICLTYVGLF